jgi:alanine racemase
MLRVTIDLEAIKHNYRVLASLSGVEVMPVVKADAYGHGLVRVAGALFAEGAGSFAVGTVDEGVTLRKSLPGALIYSYFGPAGPNDYKNLVPYAVIPVIHSWDQLSRLSGCLQSKDRLAVGLKFDTGMSRLGFKPGMAGALVDFFRANKAYRLEIITSHLAYADDPCMSEQVGEQTRIFNRVCEVFDQAGFRFKRSLANSAATLNFPSALGDIVRPGIALYGGNPFKGTSCEKKGLSLKQAMRVSAPVMSVHRLPKGTGISYGLTFTAPRDMLVAVVGCGYADNYSRSMSNRAWMLYNGKRLPVLGRVCMQLTAVDVSFAREISSGDEVFVLGGNGKGDLDVHELAGWWQTISYEVFCLLGKNEKTFINP